MQTPTIRPLTAADRDALAAAFEHLSEETRRQRFGALAKRLGERDLDHLTRIDHHRHEALAAIAPGGDIVGVARYITLADEPSTAEVAIAVDDDWQGAGIGRRLMSSLAARAQAEGITHLVAYVAPDNRRVVNWIARAGGVSEAHDGDAIRYGLVLENLARAA
jgi:ribosomal protein S18 acetylase RimI-like enzyme